MYYKQFFKSDLIGDLVSLQDMGEDMTNFDSIKILQMAYAMARADAYGKPFASFEAWLADLDNLDFSDEQFITDILDEAVDGFIRETSFKGE